MISSTIRYFVFVLLFIAAEVTPQICHVTSQYDRCSTNSACRCLHMVGAAVGTGICVMDQYISTGLAPCLPPNNWCLDQTDICINHPIYNDFPVCLPKMLSDSRICPPTTVANTSTTPAITTTTYTTTTTMSSFLPLNIPHNATWAQMGVTVAGGNGEGNRTNQLKVPSGLFVDEEDTVIVAEYGNERIVEWKRGAPSGIVLVGGNGEGNPPNQLIWPRDVIFDKETDSLIICEGVRVTRWPRRSSTRSGETIINNINCYGFAMDDEGTLYVVNPGKQEVRGYRRRETNGTVVAAGNGFGAALNQLSRPAYLSVDGEHAVYVSDTDNNRVMKWVKGAKNGTVVAGGQGQGNDLTQLSGPKGVLVDAAGNVYVADYGNDRVVRWSREASQGTIVVGGHGRGKGANQFYGPDGLSFDREGNLYVADRRNNRVQRFSLQKN